MVKKLLIAGILVTALGFSVWGFLRMRAASVSGQTDIYAALPPEPCSIVRINSLKNLKDALLYNNRYWRQLATLPGCHTVHRLLCDLDSLQESNPSIKRSMEQREMVWACYVEQDSLRPFFCIRLSDEEREQAETFLRNQPYLKLYFGHVRDILAASTDKQLLEQSLHQLSSDQTSTLYQEPGFKQVAASAGNQSSLNWLIHTQRIQPLLTRCIQPEARFLYALTEDYGAWCGYDVDFDTDRIMVNGFAYADPQHPLMSEFAGQGTGENKLTDDLPYNSFFFRHFAIPNFALYRQTCLAANLPDSTQSGGVWETSTGESSALFFQEYFDGEISLGCNPNGSFVLISLRQPQQAAKALQTLAEDLGGSDAVQKNGELTVLRFPQDGLAGSVFGAYFTLPHERVCIHRNTLIITSELALMHYIASRNPQTQTLQCSPDFRLANQYLLSASNRSLYLSTGYLLRNANQFFSPKAAAFIQRYRAVLSGFESLGMQSEFESPDKDYQHFFLQYNGTDLPDTAVTEALSTEPAPSPTENPVPEASQAAVVTPEPTATSPIRCLWQTTLDTPLQAPPAWVKNHYTGETELLVQDSQDQLYLIDQNGNILWKIQMTEPLVGEVHQVDMLRNKKLQMAFCTPTQFFIIDRNGKNLTGYPKRLPAKTQAGLSVFDYDHTRDYRFFVPLSNGQVWMCKANGKPAPDWNFTGNKKAIALPMLHSRMDGKDFLLLSAGKKSYFLDRKGKERLLLDQNIEKSARNVFYADQVEGVWRWVSTDPNGRMLVVRSNGQVLSGSLAEGCSKQHLFLHTEHNLPVRYLLYDKKQLLLFDANGQTLLQDDNIRGGKLPTAVTSGKWAAAYNEQTQDVVLYDLSKAAQAGQVEADNAYFGLHSSDSRLGSYLVVCHQGSLLLYGL